MKILCRLLRQDPNSRDGIISSASFLNILVNLLIAVSKVVVGLMASSIAIISEGVNNASDALTSVLTLVGTKLAGKHPDEKHPFGYGRIEYLTGLIISVLILITGFEVFTSSIDLIFHPEELSISILSLVIVAITAVIKFFLGVYTITVGRKTGSGALEAVGLDGRNDSFVSVITIASAIIFLVFHISLDAYVGILTSLIILKAGFDVLKDTTSDLLGRPGEKELAIKLYKEIRRTKGILNAADMMLHNYGPDSFSGSVNVEIDHKMTVGEVYEFLHELQLRIMHTYHVTMVFGIYAVDSDHEHMRKLRKQIGEFVTSHDHVKSFHAVYLDPSSNKLYCDLIVDYKLKDWDQLKEEFIGYLGKLYPEKEVELTIETEYV